MTDGAMTISRSARDRRRDLLREQQRREAELLARVTAEEDKLAAERHRADRAVSTAQAKVAKRQAVLDEAIADLAATCGAERAALLVDRAEADVRRLKRAIVRTKRGHPA